jgi:hypothetical protein
MDSTSEEYGLCRIKLRLPVRLTAGGSVFCQMTGPEARFADWPPDGGGALLLFGEPDEGKTVLLDAAATRAAGAGEFSPCSPMCMP